MSMTSHIAPETMHKRLFLMSVISLGAFVVFLTLALFAFFASGDIMQDNKSYEFVYNGSIVLVFMLFLALLIISAVVWGMIGSRKIKPSWSLAIVNSVNTFVGGIFWIWLIIMLIRGNISIGV